MSSVPSFPIESSGEYQEFRGNVIDDAFAGDVFGWNRLPTDAEMSAMYADDCRRNDDADLSAFDGQPNLQAIAAAKGEPSDARLAAMYEEDRQRYDHANDDAYWRRWHTAWWQQQLAGDSELMLIAWMRDPLPANQTNGVDLCPLIAAELMFRSGGACRAA